MKLIKIEDDYFVLKSDAALTDEEIKKLQSLSKPDVHRGWMEDEYAAIDASASKELKRELKKEVPPSSQTYKNELADNSVYIQELKNLKKSLVCNLSLPIIK